MQKQKKAIVITNPMIAANRSAEVTLSKFLRVIAPFYNEITLVGGNLSLENDLDHINKQSFPITRTRSKLKRMLDIILLQCRMMFFLQRVLEKDMPVFFWIGDKMLIPFLAAKGKGAQINYFIYGNVEKEGKKSVFSILSGKLIRYMANHADYVCMESASVADEWTDIAVKNRRIIHLYTEENRFEDITQRKKVIGMLCRLTPGKHVLESIEAMQRIHGRYPDWRMDIIGSGKQEAECRQRIQDMDAADYICLHGWIEHNELSHYMKDWKYLLFPSDTEGMPNGLLEAMAQGIPAIASKVGGIGDIIVNGQNGFLLSSTSPNAIQQAMEAAILSENYAELCARAQKTVQDEFTLRKAQESAHLSLNKE